MDIRTMSIAKHNLDPQIFYNENTITLITTLSNQQQLGKHTHLSFTL